MKINRNILPQEYSNIIDFYIARNNAGNYADAYSGDSICQYTGDNVEHTQQNINELAKSLNVCPSAIIQPRQTHTSNVQIITADTDITKPITDIDALVTARQNIVIGINTADCVPILFFDPVTNIIGAAHAGWRGTASRIAENTIKAMQSLGADTSNIVAGIAPAVSQEIYEVGNEVVEALIQAGIPKHIFAKYYPSSSKYHVDLKAANACIIQQCGVPASNIKISQLCTYKSPDCYSARRQTISSGRNYTGIILKSL